MSTSPHYDPAWVRAFYDAYGMKEWQRWDDDPVQQVKFQVHLHYLKQYLCPGEHILEVGAGAGRFTQELAKISSRLVVGDISPVQLQLNRQMAQELGYAKAIEAWVECDIVNLQAHFPEASFDSVVCYGGPLSYVFEQQDQALSELLRVLKPGGFVLLSVMSLWGTLHQFLTSILKVDPAANRPIIATGDLTLDERSGATHFCHMYRASELRQALERAGVEVELLSASNCLSATWSDALREVEKEAALWEHVLEMEIEACREQGCLDMGTHLIAVGRRRG